MDLGLSKKPLNFLRLSIWLFAGHTATKAMLARMVRIARHLGIFYNVIDSDAKHTREGHRKGDKFLRYAGKARFVYVGHGRAGRPIWEQASINTHVRSDTADIKYSLSRIS